MWIPEAGCILMWCTPKDYEITGLTAIHNKFDDQPKWYFESNSFIYIGRTQIINPFSVQCNWFNGES